MKDIMGLLVGSLFVVFVLISLLSGVRSQNSGLVTSHGKISDSEPLLLETILLQLYSTDWRYRVADGEGMD
ncbi:MAG TPA: hypothetical protein VLJ79_32010 [Candidatus Binatia bacterium]|nr:hypothetical protein [Candidatus Binatia bacterium]